MMQYSGLYLPKLYKGSLTLGSTPQDVKLTPAGKYLFLGRLDLTLSLGGSLDSLELLLELIGPNSSSVILTSGELKDALVPSGSNAYVLNAEEFNAGGSVEISLSGFRVSGSGTLSWTLHASTPVISLLTL